MKKLNNKAMTIIEILIAFVLVGIITVSIYSTISTFNNKQNVESFKEKLFTYKNTMTKMIQDDLIKRGLISANYSINNGIYTVNMNYRDGTNKQLIITRKLAMDYNEALTNTTGSKQNDVFMIEYDGTEYPIPDLGGYQNNRGEIIKDLRINNIILSTENNVLVIYIGFYHPELSTKYGINIVCPINSF